MIRCANTRTKVHHLQESGWHCKDHNTGEAASAIARGKKKIIIDIAEEQREPNILFFFLLFGEIWLSFSA